MKNVGKILFMRFSETKLEEYESYSSCILAKEKEKELVNKISEELKEEFDEVLNAWLNFYKQKGLDLVYYTFNVLNKIYDLHLEELP